MKRSRYSKYKLLNSKAKSLDLSSLKRDSFFTHDQLEFFNRLFSKFSDSLVPALNPYLSMKLKINFEKLETLKFGDFIDKVSSPIVIVVFTLNNNTKGIFLFDYYLTFSFLDRILGGKGESISQIRDLTEIEIRIFLNTIVKTISNIFSDIWKVVNNITINIDSLYNSIHNAIIHSYSEDITLMTFSFNWQSTDHIFQLLLPYRFMVYNLPKLNLSNLFVGSSSQEKGNPTLINIVKKRINESKVEVTAELGNSEVMFQDLVFLAPGDIITLDSKLEDLVKVKISGEVRFLGKPVIYNKRLSIKIMKLAEEEEEDVSF